MAIKCRIWYDLQSQGYCITMSYGNKDIVEAMKHLIPSGDRDYDPTTHIWYVKESYGPAIKSIAESAFGIGSVSFTSKQVAEQATQQQSQRAFGNAGPMLNPAQGTTEDAVLAFFALASFDDAKRLYRATAMLLHPDKGGDASKMARLNELWAKLEKEYFKR